MSVVPLDAVERLEALRVAERTFQMTEEAFRVFYETTSRSLWGYPGAHLRRPWTGGRSAAGNLLPVPPSRLTVRG